MSFNLSTLRYASLRFASRRRRGRVFGSASGSTTTVHCCWKRVGPPDDRGPARTWEWREWCGPASSSTASPGESPVGTRSVDESFHGRSVMALVFCSKSSPWYQRTVMSLLCPGPMQGFMRTSDFSRSTTWHSRRCGPGGDDPNIRCSCKGVTILRRIEWEKQFSTWSTVDMMSGFHRPIPKHI